MRPFPSALVIIVATTFAAPAADIATLIRTIKAVGPEGAGNTQACAAWRELSQLPATDLPQLLAAVDDASPAAANWLRTAADAVAERERTAGRPLPVAALDSFVRDTRHDARGRRLAYELLCAADPTAPNRLLPKMLDDPGAELRFDAVEAAFAALKGNPADSVGAKVDLRKLLSSSRDGQQIERIARELTRRGASVDLVAHFGYIVRWQVAGVFDNADGRGFQTAFAPEHRVDLAAKYKGKDGASVAWRPVTMADKAGAIDLNRLFPDTTGKRKGMKAVVAYGYTEIESPVEQAVEVRAASSTAIKVFVNGHEILAREVYHQSFDRDMYVARARLARGRNSILVKVCQDDQSEAWAQNWMYQVRLTDSLGAAVPIASVTPGVEPTK
jgi:hypothetical protein